MELNIIELIKSDFKRYGEDIKFNVFSTALMYFRKRGFSYSFWLRLCNSSNIFIRYIAIVNHYRLSTKLSIQIPYQTKIGYGLQLGHGTSIIINKHTIIGNNVNISHFVSIGTNNKRGANISDSVYIGPNTSIIGSVDIGSNVRIGAGSVLTKDALRNSIYAGVPAKFLKENTEPLKNLYNEKK